MERSVRVEGFRPSTSGFHFANQWLPSPFLTIPFPAGRLKIGNAANGLCGGMVYAVRDFFEDGISVPAGAENPVAGTALYDYITRRSVDSFDLPQGALKYLAWMAPTTNQFARTVAVEWPKVRGELAGGRLVTLGMIRTSSFWPGAVGRNHQCLAWGFDEDTIPDADAHQIVLYLYDPNHPDADDVTVSFRTAEGGGPPNIVFRVGGVSHTEGDEATRGCFVTAYEHVSPAAAVGQFSGAVESRRAPR